MVTRITMRRLGIAGLLCAGAAIPVAAASIFLFGCCVLPFHRVLHRYLPICGGIVSLMTPDSHSNASVAAAVPGRRLACEGARHHTEQPSRDEAAPANIFPTRAFRIRDQIAHGALRCDEDVGLHLLLSVMLI